MLRSKASCAWLWSRGAWWSSPALAWLRQRRVPVRAAPFSPPVCLAQENRTRGGGRRHRASITPGSERDQIMSTNSKSAVRNQPVRHVITFELVQAHAPNAGLATNLSRTFGLDPVDYPAILERTEEHVALSAQTLQDALNEKACASNLQRVVGSFVGSAYGATSSTAPRSRRPAISPWHPRTTIATRTVWRPWVSKAKPNVPGSSPPKWGSSLRADGRRGGRHLRLRSHYWRRLETLRARSRARHWRQPPVSIRRDGRLRIEAPRRGPRGPRRFSGLVREAPPVIFPAPRWTRIGRCDLRSVTGVSPPFRLALPRKGCRSRRVRM